LTGEGKGDRLRGGTLVQRLAFRLPGLLVCR
jgi:hypothetical protein